MIAMVKSTRRKFLRLGICGLVALGGLGLFFSVKGCRESRSTAVSGKFKRVIVLGMDGLDPNLVKEFMNAGMLPNFSRLAREGSFKRLQVGNPAMTPVVWSDVATGATSGQHGIFDFLHRDPQTYMPMISFRKDTISLGTTKYLKARKREGFWAYTSEAGIPTSVLRWPVTFPAESVKGRFLSGLGVPDLLGTEGIYTYYTTAPDPNDRCPENVTEVAWKGNTIQTSIKGPATGKNRFATLSLQITKNNSQAVTIQIEGCPAIQARVGQWTPWSKLSFKVGFSRVYGMIKFLLAEAEPNLHLYASPINLDPSRQVFPFTYPLEFGSQLEKQLGPFHTLGMPEQVHPLTHGRYDLEAFLAEVQNVHQERAKMLERALNDFDAGVLAFVFDHPDRVQHVFWSTRDPQHPAYNPEEAQKYADAIPQTYRQMDEALGMVLSKVDNKTLLLVLSDHGFGSFRRAVHLNRWLIENGFMNLRMTNNREARGIFQDVDWARTKAYAVGFTSIYLNIAGREGQGIVAPGEEAEKLRQEISERLVQFKDPDHGTPVVHRVYVGKDIYPGPEAESGPDLVVGFKPGYRASWQTALGGAPLQLIEDNKTRWTGDHLFDPSFVPGILLSNQKINSPDPKVTDIAPTVLHALGLVKPKHLTGNNLVE